MQICESQTDRQSLEQFGHEAVALLRDRDFRAMAERFGYALAYGREPQSAIEVDLIASLSEGVGSLGDIAPSMVIKYFDADEAKDSGLVAAVECITHVADGSPVLLALAVTRRGIEWYITLEGIDRVL